MTSRSDPMEIKDYIPLALRTKSSIPVTGKPHIDDLLHSAIGLATEGAELATFDSDVNFFEEIGDLMWYTAIGFNAVGMANPGIPDRSDAGLDTSGEWRPSFTKEVWRVACVTLDIMKKVLFYGSPLDRRIKVSNIESSIETHLKAYLMRMYDLCSHMAILSGTTLSDVMEANISKLKARYPEKFTEDKASNRDLATETKILSEKGGFKLEADAQTSKRKKDEVFEALAELNGGYKNMTSFGLGAVRGALKAIRDVVPGVTADEIRRRAANYRTHYASLNPTATALAKHWAICDKPLTKMVPPWKRIQDLEVVIAKHPANPSSVEFSADRVTDDQRCDLKRLRDELNEAFKAQAAR